MPTPPPGNQGYPQYPSYYGQPAAPQQQPYPTVSQRDLEQMRQGKIPAPGANDEVSHQPAGVQRKIGENTQRILNSPFVERMDRQRIEEEERRRREGGGQLWGAQAAPAAANNPFRGPAQNLDYTLRQRAERKMREEAALPELEKIRRGLKAAPGVKDMVSHLTGVQRTIMISVQATANRPYVEMMDRQR